LIFSEELLNFQLVIQIAESGGVDAGPEVHGLRFDNEGWCLIGPFAFESTPNSLVQYLLETRSSSFNGAAKQLLHISVEGNGCSHKSIIAS